MTDAKADKAPQTFDQTVEEFCAATSATDNRIELLSAFCAMERAAGRFKDSADAYAARLDTFANAPA